MPSTMKPKQLARLDPETVRVIQSYRKDIERQGESTPSVNKAINNLIVMGYELFAQRHAARKAEAQR